MIFHRPGETINDSFLEFSSMTDVSAYTQSSRFIHLEFLFSSYGQGESQTYRFQRNLMRSDDCNFQDIRSFSRKLNVIDIPRFFFTNLRIIFHAILMMQMQIEASQYRNEDGIRIRRLEENCSGNFYDANIITFER